MQGALRGHLCDSTAFLFRMESHSGTCYQTQVNAPRLNPQLNLSIPLRDERLSWLGGWVYTETVYCAMDTFNGVLTPCKVARIRRLPNWCVTDVYRLRINFTLVLCLETAGLCACPAIKHSLLMERFTGHTTKSFPVGITAPLGGINHWRFSDSLIGFKSETNEILSYRL